MLAHSEAVFLLLLIHFLLFLTLFVQFCVWHLLGYAVLIVLSRFANMLIRKRELVDLL